MRRSLQLVSILLTASATLVGCGDEDGPDSAAESPYDPSEDRSEYTDPAPAEESFDPSWRETYEDSLSLPDGRKVRLWYSEGGNELKEQHYSPDEDAWTAPQVLRTSDEPDPCQGIHLDVEDDLVVVIADFGMYCYDGEPPFDSIAAVSYGDLTEWEVHGTPEFDGWTDVTVDGDTVTWTGSGAQLTWNRSEGFSDVTG